MLTIKIRELKFCGRLIKNRDDLECCIRDARQAIKQLESLRFAEFPQAFKRSTTVNVMNDDDDDDE